MPLLYESKLIKDTFFNSISICFWIICKKKFCNPIWIIWLKILRKRLYHDLQHLISKQFAGDRTQPHDTISSNSADDRKRQIVDQDHHLALRWLGCNHSPEIGSGLNCIGNNCDPLKALCFRPHNTSRSRLGRYSPEIFNPCLQPSLHYWFLLNYDSKDLQLTKPSFSFSFSQMSTDVYVFPTQSWKHHQSQDIILRLRERETLLTRFQSLRPSSFSIRAARKERIGSFDLIVMINILHLLPVHGTSDQALWSYDHTRYSNAVVLYPKPL